MGLFLKMHLRHRQRIRTNLVKAAGIWIGESRRLVAIDTGELVASLKVGRTTEEANRISVELGSYGVGYAKWVDLGNGAIASYHRNKKVVYIGQGQFFLSRAKENVLGEIITTIKQ